MNSRRTFSRPCRVSSSSTSPGTSAETDLSNMDIAPSLRMRSARSFLGRAVLGRSFDCSPLSETAVPVAHYDLGAMRFTRDPLRLTDRVARSLYHRPNDTPRITINNASASTPINGSSGFLERCVLPAHRFEILRIETGHTRLNHIRQLRYHSTSMHRRASGSGSSGCQYVETQGESVIKACSQAPISLHDRRLPCPVSATVCGLPPPVSVTERVAQNSPY